MVKKHTWSLDSRDAKIYLQNILENISDTIYFKDRESRFLLVNEACRKKHGFKDLDATIGKTDADVFSEAHAHQALEDEQRIIATGEPMVGIEEKETWPDGRVTWVSTTKVPLRDPEGNIIGTFGISRDITAKKEADLLAAQYAAEIKNLKEAIEEDVRMAGELQKAFFPRRYPVFPQNAGPGEECVEFGHLSKSSGMVGGDLCCIKQVSTTEAGLFLCDVMGHGVRAALGTAILRSLIEELAPIETDPGCLLTHMNQRVFPILRQSRDMMFVTALYLIIDTSNGAVRYATAGHPPPMRYSRLRGKPVRPDRSPESAALALFEDSQYRTTERSIDPGDILLLYTDGIFEASNSQNQQFGIRRLGRTLAENAGQPVPGLLKALLAEAQAFSNSKSLEDDVCLVGLRWSGQGKRIGP